MILLDFITAIQFISETYFSVISENLPVRVVGWKQKIKMKDNTSQKSILINDCKTFILFLSSFN